MGNQSLVLQSMGRNATGNYYCVATNAEGTTFSNPVQLDIKCKQNCKVKLLVVVHFQITLCTEVRFASFLSVGFITAIVVDPPERKLTKHTSVQ